MKNRTFCISLRKFTRLRTWYGHPGLVMGVLSAGLSSQFVSQLYAQWLSTDPANAFCRSNNNPFSQVSWVNVPLAHLKYRLHVVGSGYSCSPKGSGQLLTNSINWKICIFTWNEAFYNWKKGLFQKHINFFFFQFSISVHCKINLISRKNAD